jgi:DNA-binding CsgD family transcriptional regulator
MAWAAIDTAQRGGIAIAPLFEGLPFDNASVRQMSRVRWEDYCAIAERIADACGGPAELEDLLESNYHLVLPELRELAGAVVSPTQYVRFIFEVLDPIMFPPIAFGFEEVEPDRVRITCRCRAGVRPCEAIDRGTVGALRGITRLLDLPPAKVELLVIAPGHVVYDVRLPPAPTWGERGRRASHAVRRLFVRLVLGATREGHHLAAEIGEPEAEPVVVAIAALQLTPRQGQVLERVAEGLTNKEIAQLLGTAENTIELHITRILRKAGASSRAQLLAKLWSRTWGFPQ